MRGVNKVILIGNLGRDPEVRYLPSGIATANITLATSESWKDKNTGQAVEHTEWHRVVFFGKLAEIVSEYLKKGSKVYVEGSLTTRKWQDKQTGQDRYSTEIRAQSMQMLDSKGGGQAGSGFDSAMPSYEGDGSGFGSFPDEGVSAARPAPARGTAAPSQTGRPAAATTMPPIVDMDDDIPF